MGMFDSFNIKKNGKNYEVQTKQLDCNLDYYYFGDAVPSIDNNIKSFVIVDYDWQKSDDGKYTDDNKDWYGFIIYNNIYLDFIELSEENDPSAEELLKSYINNPKFVVNRLTEILNEKNILLNDAKSKVYFVESAVRDCIEFKKGGFDDDKNGFLMMLHKHAEYFKNGGTLEDLLKDHLNVKIW